MKRIISKILSFGYFFAGYWILLSNYAHAYIDPSAVTYLIQAIAAVFIALGALITVFRHKIAAFFKKDSGDAKKREIHLKDEE